VGDEGSVARGVAFERTGIEMVSATVQFGDDALVPPETVDLDPAPADLEQDVALGRRKVALPEERREINLELATGDVEAQPAIRHDVAKGGDTAPTSMPIEKRRQADGIRQSLLLSLTNDLMEAITIQDGREVQQGAADRRDRDAVLDGPLVGRKPALVDAPATPRDSSTRSGHLGDARPPNHTSKGRSGSVAQHCSGARSQDTCHPSPLDAQPPTADCEHTAVNDMEAPLANSDIDRAIGEPPGTKLGSRHHAVLSLRELRDYSLPMPSRNFAPYIGENLRLGGHAPRFATTL